MNHDPDRMKIGVAGCGTISAAYLQTLRSFPSLEVVACADSVLARAQATAAEFAIDRVCSSAKELFADGEVELVLNLTPPRAHAAVSLAALVAGKHVYCEKPLGVDRGEGRRLVVEAAQRGLRLASAPDTFLGPGWQRARALVDGGAIGRPLGLRASMLCPGPEGWHPNPAAFYQVGGGPMLDMGVYYLTALVFLLGPIRRVSGLTTIGVPELVIGSGPNKGQRLPVETPTHIAGALEFEAGAIGTIMTSFETAESEFVLELYGTEGMLALPDPNCFDGELRIHRHGRVEPVSSLPTHPPELGRGLGVADLASAIRSGRPHRASGELALHVLDAMLGFVDSRSCGCRYELKYRCEQPAALEDDEVANWLADTA